MALWLNIAMKKGIQRGGGRGHGSGTGGCRYNYQDGSRMMVAE